MRYWLITDTHYGHDKMVEYCGRPANFEKQITVNWKKMVKPEDVIIHLGDVCIGSDPLYNHGITWLPGRKILVRGNHDKKSIAWYFNAGWDFVCDSFSMEFAGKNILFSHQPKEIGKFDLNIHGHFHNQLPRLLRGEWVVSGEKERNHYDLAILTDKHLNLSIEETNYQPVLLESFISKMASKD